MKETILTPPPHTPPTVFTRAQLDWLPWLEPLAVDAMTERHLASLVDRVKSPYFRLLARDPDALEARTRTDKDIFYNPDAGLPRAERELAAAATSRFNGCLYCASVHARHAATYSRREADVDRLLAAGDDAQHVRAGARGSPAPRRARRSGDLRRHPRLGVLQLGQPPDALAGRARDDG
jgi:AhpD family alkylhydroperoxidase